jgi:hypothetical protein
MTDWKRTSRLVAILTFAATTLVLAQTIDVPDWENSVRFELLASQDRVRPGDKLELAVVAEIDKGYHLYGPEEKKPNRTEVKVEGDLFLAGDPVFPPVVTRDLSGLGKYDLYEGKVAIRIPVSLSQPTAGRREVPVDVRINYQVCTDVACSAPTHRTLSLVLPVADKGAPIEHRHGHIFNSKK